MADSERNDNLLDQVEPIDQPPRPRRRSFSIQMSSPPVHRYKDMHRSKRRRLSSYSPDTREILEQMFDRDSQVEHNHDFAEDNEIDAVSSGSGAFPDVEHPNDEEYSEQPDGLSNRESSSDDEETDWKPPSPWDTQKPYGELMPLRRRRPSEVSEADDVEMEKPAAIEWTEREETIFLILLVDFGRNWARIADVMTGRTAEDFEKHFEDVSRLRPEIRLDIVAEEAQEATDCGQVMFEDTNPAVGRFGTKAGRNWLL